MCSDLSLSPPSHLQPGAQGDASQQLDTLLERTDWVRAALAGNLASLELELKDGRVVPLRRALYHGTQVRCLCVLLL